MDRVLTIQARKDARLICQVCGKPVPPERKYATMYCSYRCKKSSPARTSPGYRRKAFASSVRIKYKLSVEEYAHLLNDQDHRCTICGTREWGGISGNPHVDHCHTSGRVRSLLCDRCNRGIGIFLEDPERLTAAAAYLRSHALALIAEAAAAS